MVNENLEGSRDTSLVSIIIPSKDRKQRLIRALQFIEFNTMYRPFEVIVIIDGGEDYGIKLSKDCCRIIRNEKSLDYFACINQGVDKAKGDYIVYLADDVEVCPRWLEFAMKDMEKELDGEGLVGFYDGIQPKNAPHGLISKKFFNEIRTDEYVHFFRDEEMTLRALKAGKYFKSKLSMVMHYHYFINGLVDETYKGSVEKNWDVDRATFKRRNG